MKLKEITAAEFKEKLKDPEVAEVKQWVKEIDAAINAKFEGNWEIELLDAPEDFYDDKYITINRMTSFRPSESVAYAAFNVAAQIISIPSLHDVRFAHMNQAIKQDIEIAIAFGREGLYTRYSPDDLEAQRMNR
jgi:hypothetical protein